MHFGRADGLNYDSQLQYNSFLWDRSKARVTTLLSILLCLCSLIVDQIAANTNFILGLCDV